MIFTSDNGPTSAGGADPQFFNGSCVDTYTGAMHEVGPHFAPLAIRFVRPGSSLPDRYVGKALVVAHGSWNRPPGKFTGYKVLVYTFSADGTKVVAEEDLAEHIVTLLCSRGNMKL